jgi:hypothetical protein
MGYLVYNDYAVTIQDFAFKQWIASNDAFRLQAEPRAQAKIKEFLVQKYDLVNEFANTTIYYDAITYQANALTQLNYPAWVLGAYTVGQYVSFTDGNVYRCILNTTTNQSPPNTTYWLLIGSQLQLQYLQYPYPLFNLYGFYNIGDIIFWQGKIYQCLQATIYAGHQAQIQRSSVSKTNIINFFPTDTINGAKQWGVGVSYSVIGKYPNFVATKGVWNNATAYVIGDTVTDTSNVLWQSLTANTNKTPGADITNWQSITWIVGDNRNQSIVDAYIAIVLWYLSPRISPQVLPKWVEAKFTMAKEWLQDAADGKITLDVPELQPSEGNRIRFGGSPKLNFDW